MLPGGAAYRAERGCTLAGEVANEVPGLRWQIVPYL